MIWAESSGVALDVGVYASASDGVSISADTVVLPSKNIFRVIISPNFFIYRQYDRRKGLLTTLIYV